MTQAEVKQAIEVFSYMVLSRELHYFIPYNDYTAYSDAWFAAICTTSTAGVLNLILKSRAEIEWEAYRAWRENAQTTTAYSRLYNPAVRFTPTPVGFSLVLNL